MSKNMWNLVKDGVKVVSISMALTVVAVAIRTLIWMPQIF